MASNPTQGLTAETRDLIAAVLEAIDVPYAATTGGAEVRAKILAERVMQLTVSLRLIAEAADRGDRYMDEKFAHGMTYLREQIAEMPPEGYVTAEQAKARVAAGADWMDAVRLDYGQPADDAGDAEDGPDEPDGPGPCSDWCTFAGVPHAQHQRTVFYDERTATGAPHGRGTPDAINTVDVVQDGAEPPRIEVAVYRGAVNEGRPDVVSFTPAGAAKAARWWPPRFARGLADAVRLLAGDTTATAGAA